MEKRKTRIFKLTIEDMAMAMELYSLGLALQDIAAKFDVGAATLSKNMRDAEEHGFDAFNPNICPIASQYQWQKKHDRRHAA